MCGSDGFGEPQRGGKMSVRHSTQLPSEDVAGGTETQRQVLIGPNEGPHFAMRKFIMQPGGGMPPHTNTVEHQQYVLGGKARVGIGDEVFDVEKDDVVFIPAETPHWYEAVSEEPFEFLCMVPNLPDRIALVETEEEE